MSEKIIFGERLDKSSIFTDVRQLKSHKGFMYFESQNWCLHCVSLLESF
jgi:hypothetical protein